MTFLEAFDLHPYDTIAISKAMGIKEHEADSMVNAKMERDRRGPEAVPRAVQVPKPKRRRLISYAGFDEKENHQLARR